MCNVRLVIGLVLVIGSGSGSGSGSGRVGKVLRAVVVGGYLVGVVVVVVVVIPAVHKHVQC